MWFVLHLRESSAVTAAAQPQGGREAACGGKDQEVKHRPGHCADSTAVILSLNSLLKLDQLFDAPLKVAS